MNKIVDRLKIQFEENPLGVIAVGALAATAAAKVLQALNASRNSHTWAKEVDRRRFMTTYK